jgi:hypothetical protein
VADGAAAYADCMWASVGLSGGPWIAPESMRRLADLGLPLVICFYAVDEDGVWAGEHLARKLQESRRSHRNEIAE